MPSSNFIPSRESELVTWVNTFRALIVATPTAYGLTAPQATSYDALATTFLDAYALANADATRSPSNIVAKNDAKRPLIDNTRVLARIVQANPSVTDEQKTSLGLTVRSEPSPIPAPAFAPVIDIVSVSANTVKVRMHDPANTTRRGLPPGCAGLTLFSFVGPSAPTDSSAWIFQGNTTRSVVSVNFPSAAPGAKVWFTAFYRNERDQSGPAADPISTNIAGGGAMAA